MGLEKRSAKSPALIAFPARQRKNGWPEPSHIPAKDSIRHAIELTVMPLRDPVAAYIAASNIEAHLVRNLLIEAGIDAAVEEDVSQIGAWMFGLASQLHRPKVWIERADLARAAPIVAAYESDCSARRAAERGDADSTTEPIAVTCEECGASTTYPTELRGTVQTYPKCQAYVDVGDDDPGFEWN